VLPLMVVEKEELIVLRSLYDMPQQEEEQQMFVCFLHEMIRLLCVVELW
jgi:hypothetical protein